MTSHGLIVVRRSFLLVFVQSWLETHCMGTGLMVPFVTSQGSDCLYFPTHFTTNSDMRTRWDSQEVCCASDVTTPRLSLPAGRG